MQTTTESQSISIDPNWKVAVVRSCFNEEMTQGLLDVCLNEMKQLGFHNDQVDVVEVPGAFEIPLICKKVAMSDRYDAIITLGSVIKGATNHFDIIKSQLYTKLSAAIPRKML